jgi:hypothetical protein
LSPERKPQTAGAVADGFDAVPTPKQVTAAVKKKLGKPPAR